MRADGEPDSDSSGTRLTGDAGKQTGSPLKQDSWGPPPISLPVSTSHSLDELHLVHLNRCPLDVQSRKAGAWRERTSAEIGFFLVLLPPECFACTSSGIEKPVVESV